jgi:hypothetical protein
MPKVKLMWHAGPESPPEEKNEYEYENEYEKKYDFMRILVPILVLFLQSPSLTLPRKIGEGSCGVTAARWAVYFRSRQLILLTYTF